MMIQEAHCNILYYTMYCGSAIMIPTNLIQQYEMHKSYTRSRQDLNTAKLSTRSKPTAAASCTLTTESQLQDTGNMGAGLRIAKKCLPGITQVDVRKQKISAEAKARAANPYRQWNQTLHGNDHVSDNDTSREGPKGMVRFQCVPVCLPVTCSKTQKP